MDIAALSMAMSSVNLQSAYSVAMLGNSLEQAKTTGSEVVALMDSAAMERSVTPYLGSNFDVSV